MQPEGQRTLFLCGDVMTGRGVDQVLPHSCPPRLYEPVVTSALDYVALAERANGPIPRRVAPDYVWGDALEILERTRPTARILNLETSITTNDEPDPKGINYRMHPQNTLFLTAAGVDCCVLANNHVLDWRRAGLLETLENLEEAGIAVAGAGRDLRAARAPAVLDATDSGRNAPAGGSPVPTGEGNTAEELSGTGPSAGLDAAAARGRAAQRRLAHTRASAALDRKGPGRVLVFAFGSTDSGIPRSWAASDARPGVHLLPDLSDEAVDAIARLVEPTKRPGDVVVASIHWGQNWGFEIPTEHRRFAHALIDRALIDVVHGHSSHHPKAIEVHGGRLILYGCGDFLNDYEGIGGYEEFRADLTLMYFPTFDAAAGRLVRLEMRPLQIRNFRLNRPAQLDLVWLRDTLDRECHRFGHKIELRDDALALRWA